MMSKNTLSQLGVGLRLSGDADPLPCEIWQRASSDVLAFVTGHTDSVPLRPDADSVSEPAAFTREPALYDETVMTLRRQQAVRQAAASFGEVGVQFLDVVRIPPE